MVVLDGQLTLGQKVFPKRTEEQIALAKEKRSAGKKLTKEDRVLLIISDGEWHMGNELAEKVSWRFGGYLFTLKEKGVSWEKEKVKVASGDSVWKYRLCEWEAEVADHA